VKLQIASRIAIFALLELADESDRQLSVAEIGQKYRLSSHHLAKVMNQLGRAGMVSAVRGAGGGYQFSGNPRRITLLDVIQLFEQFGSEEGEGTEPGEGTAEGAILRQIMTEIDDIARATFGSITIATMLKMRERQKNAQQQTLSKPRRRQSR
jgi:Rrf2 family nitric oxide-sensitive transcriptional repressor